MLLTIFQSDSQFSHGHIYDMQVFKTAWVNSPAYQNYTEVVSWLVKF